MYDNGFSWLLGMLNGDIEPGKSIGKYKENGDFVSTAQVGDGKKPYETLIHPAGYDREVIVESYDTEEEAVAGHTKWVEKVKSKDLPDVIADIDNVGWGLDVKSHKLKEDVNE